MYSLSYEYFDWSSKFAPQDEIRKYLDHVVNKYHLQEDIVFNTIVNQAEWSQTAKTWKITTSKGDYYANVIINASGVLHEPNVPHINGAEKFKGYSVHTSAMRKKYSSANQNIAVIGSAASALQLIPRIAKDAKNVYVFQRTPNWVLKKGDYPYPGLIRTLFQYVPILASIYRLWIYIENEYLFYLLFRKESEVNNFLKTEITKDIAKILNNDELTKKFIPDYPIGCKRILISPNLEYIHAFKKDNVKLITDPIKGITEDSISTAKDQFHIDQIIYATGFHPGENHCKFIGIDGKVCDLEYMKRNSYKGICFPHLPNFYTLLGPNTILGHNTVVFMMECQVDFIMKVIEYQMTHDKQSVTVKEHAALNWTNSIPSRLANSVWTACSSYYKDKSGLNFTIYPGYTFTYWGELLLANWNKLHYFTFQ
uniref:Flavin-containing monooxygenase n=1 Tax=Arcella intermedia TaxID=1963864 RepID=A0A6B2L351_9EUKA